MKVQTHTEKERLFRKILHFLSAGMFCALVHQQNRDEPQETCAFYTCYPTVISWARFSKLGCLVAWPFTAIDTANILSEKQITYGIAVSLWQSPDKESHHHPLLLYVSSLSSHFWPHALSGLACSLFFCSVSQDI